MFVKPEGYENNDKTILEKVISLCALIIITNYNVTLGLIIALLIIIRIEYNTRFENFVSSANKKALTTAQASDQASGPGTATGTATGTAPAPATTPGPATGTATGTAPAPAPAPAAPAVAPAPATTPAPAPAPKASTLKPGSLAWLKALNAGLVRAHAQTNALM